MKAMPEELCVWKLKPYLIQVETSTESSHLPMCEKIEDRGTSKLMYVY